MPVLRLRRHWRRPGPKEAILSLSLILAGIIAAPVLVLWAPAIYVSLGSITGNTHPLPGQVMGANGTLTIIADSGGNVAQRMIHARQLRAAEVPVVVEGLCASACTIYLTLPQSCTRPDALWMFHGFVDSPAAAVLPRALASRTRQSLLNAWLAQFPRPLAAWMRAIDEQGSAEHEVWLTGAELAQAGWIRTCNPTHGTDRRSLTRQLSRGFVPPYPLPHNPG